MKGKTINEMKIGDFAVFRKTVTEGDVYNYAGISGDQNPVHIDKVYGENSKFGSRIAHGMFTASFISTLVGMYLPGPGSIYCAQELKFTAPVRFGDTIEAKAEVVEIIPEKNRVKLHTTCTNQDGVLVVDGFATMLAPK